MDAETRLNNLERMVTNMANNISDQKLYYDADKEGISKRMNELENKMNAIDKMIRQGGK